MNQPELRNQIQSESLEKFTQFALQLADIGRQHSMKYFRKPLKIDNKADSSPVTIADREVEMLMRAHINKYFPEHGISGEEHGLENVDQAELWVLDPIDGTKSFVTGMPTFGSLISFLNDGLPVIGVVEMPALNER